MKKINLSHALAGAALFVAFSASADLIKVEQDRLSALYSVGETASFKVTVTDDAGQAFTNGVASWKLDNFGSRSVGGGKIDLARQNPFAVSGTLDEPGFLRLTVTAGQKSVVWSVGYDVGKIRQNEPRPADFDAYWAGEKARLKREVPLDPRCEKVERLSGGKWTTYSISFATFNSKRVWGFMTVPKAGRPPYRCRVRICDAGNGATGPWEANDGEVTATINVFDFEPADTAEEQIRRKNEMCAREAKRYGLKPGSYCALAGIGESREDYYFHDAMLGIDRAIDWLAERPEVDPRRLVYYGSSQGGGFGLYVNYLNPRFSRAVIAVPAATGHYGFRQNRQDGWPNLIAKQPPAKRAAAEKFAAYFDGVNFAAGIHTPVRFLVGFSDTCCPPPDVYAAYNACPAKDKAIANCVGAEHCGKNGFLVWLKNNPGKPSWFDHEAWLRSGGANLLDGSAFSAGDAVPNGWHLSASSAVKASTTDAVRHGLPASLKIVAPAETGKTWNMLRRQVDGIRANTSYTISAWVKTEGCAKDAMAYISLNCDKGGRRIASNDSDTKVVGDSGWRRIVHVVKALPAGTQVATFVCCLYGTGTAYFTEPKVEEGTVATDWCESAADLAAVRKAAEMREASEAWKASKGLAGLPAGTARIAVLDLGLGAGRGAFGCTSDPQVFVKALAPLGKTFVVSGDDFATPGVLTRESVDLLVVPTGSAWPADAADELVGYLSGGGSLFTCGGYAFDTPVWFRDGRWTRHDPPPVPAATTPVALPGASSWNVSTPAGGKATVADVKTAEGGTAVEVGCGDFHLWASGGFPLPAAAFRGRHAISFRVRSLAGAKDATLEINERDGSRWQVHVPVTAAWREYRFADSDFRHFGDSAAVGRGVAGDCLNFDRVTQLRIGSGPGEAEEMKPLRLQFAELKVGDDPYAAERRRVVPQINTRTAKIRDAIHPKETQVNAFDPSFELRNAVRLATAPEMAGELPQVSLAGAFTGLAAIAQLGVSGHGYSANRCAWRPILAATAADGADRGPAAAFVHHHSGRFAGSDWAIFGVDNVDLFPSVDAPLAKTLLPEIAKRLLAHVALNETTTGYASYRAGETAKLVTRVGNFGRRDLPVQVRFTLRDEQGRALGVRNVGTLARAGENTEVTAEWPVGADAPDYVAFTAELLAGEGVAADREPGAFVVWNERTLAGGPKIELKGTRFAIDGKPGFYVGAQTYWGQTRPTVARSPMSFYRDFRQMREHGLRLTRLFLPWTCEADKRISDACVQLAQKFGIVIYHTQQNISTMVLGEDLKTQNGHFREIGTRYRDVPGFMIDIRNEPHMDLEPSWESARRMRNWLDTDRAAAREGRPDAIVSVGWSQGWAGGAISKDPAWCSLDLDFTDRHYYGPPEKMFRDLKDVDMRALGKPLTMPECGAKCHPTFVKEDPWHMGDTEEGYDYRFRCLMAQAFGLGGTALLGWHWRDPMEGIFPCGLVHATNVARPTAKLFSRIGRAFGRLRLKDNPPDVVVRLREEPRMDRFARAPYLNKAYVVDEALKYWGANWSKITESAVGGCKAKLVLDPDALPTDDLAALRAKVGELLKAKACAFTRRAEDPETLDTYRVPGEGATGWVFWNAAEQPVTTVREGQTVTVPAKGLVYLQLAADGTVEVRETL